MNRPTPKQREKAVGFAAIVDRVATSVALERSLSKQDVFAVIDAFAAELFATVRKTERVTWPGRGTFRITKRKARDVLNPMTGARMRIPLSVGIGFRAALAERERLRGPV